MKPTTFNNSRYNTNIPTDPCTVTTADIKANMCDIHTSIVSQHLAARDNNKILRTHPPQVSSTEENLHRHTRRTLAQLRTNKSPFLLSYLHKIDASTHPSPLCPLCRTHEHTTQHLFSCPQICTTLSALDLWRDPSGVAALLDDWREKLAAISREEWVENNNISSLVTSIHPIANTGCWGATNLAYFLVYMQIMSISSWVKNSLKKLISDTNLDLSSLVTTSCSCRSGTSLGRKLGIGSAGPQSTSSDELILQHK